MNKTLLKNICMLYFLNIAKMVFPLITLPYLTRVLTVECFGVVAFVKAVMQFMQIFVDFGFNLSGTKDIVLIRENKDRLEKEIGNILLAKVMLSALALVSLIGLLFIFDILKDNKLFTVLSFLGVFFTVFLLDFFFRGIERMEFITIRFVIMKGIAIFLTFFVVNNDNDIIWIPILDLLGTGVAIFWVIRVLKGMGIKISFDDFSTILDKIKKSATYFFSLIASGALMGLNTLVIGIYLSTSHVAYWSICMQVVAGVQSFYAPLTDAIYPHMVKCKSLIMIKKAMTMYVPLILVGCVITWFIAEDILIIVAGSQYVEAAIVLKYLIPVLFFSFPVMMFGWPTLGAIGKEKYVTKTTTVTLGIQIIGLLIIVVMNDFNLINVAILRGGVELIFLLMRLRYCCLFRREFVG